MDLTRNQDLAKRQYSKWTSRRFAHRRKAVIAFGLDGGVYARLPTTYA